MPQDKEFQTVYNQIRLLKGGGVNLLSIQETKKH